MRTRVHRGLAAVLAAALAGSAAVSLSGAAAAAVPSGSLSVSPASGSTAVSPFVTIDAPCPAGTTEFYILMMGGAAGFEMPADGQLIQPPNANAATVADLSTTGVQTQFAFDDVRADAALPAYNQTTGNGGLRGSYSLELSCSDGLSTLGTFSGSVSFTGSAGQPNSYTFVPPAPISGAVYQPVAPVRVLPFTSVGAAATFSLDLDGAGGVTVPAGASAVALNVTAAGVSANTYVSVCPGDVPVNTCKQSSNLNPSAGRDTPNYVIVKLGAGNKVTFYNNAGSLGLIADLQGWFVTEAQASGVKSVYQPTNPTRVVQPSAVTGGSAITVDLDGAGGVTVPAGATAVALNVTAAGVGSNTYVSVCPGDAAVNSCKQSSNLNPYAGNDTPNYVIVKLGAGNTIKLYNNVGSLLLLADLQGWFVDSTQAVGSAAKYQPTNPTRVLQPTTVSGGNTTTLDLDGAGGVTVPAGATAVALNVTAAGVTANSYVSVCPGDVATATCKQSSNLNPYAGRDVPNYVIVKLGAGNTVKLYNNVGSMLLLADLQGWFVG